MKLGVQVSFGSATGTQLQLPLPKRGTAPPIFGPYLLWPNGWMDQDATWYEGRLGPGHIVLHGDTASPKKEHNPQFSAHVYCFQTVAHLSYC